MSTTSPVPTPSELDAVIAGLATSRDALLHLCAPLSPEQWAASDGPGRWTVAQVLEHLVIVERRSLGMHQHMLAQPAEPDWEERTAARDAVLHKAAVPEVKINAPAPLHPTSEGVPAQLLEEFAAARAATMDFAGKPGQALKEHTREHPILGPLNGYQWLLLGGHHTQRHIHQMKGCLAANA